MSEFLRAIMLYLNQRDFLMSYMNDTHKYTLLILLLTQYVYQKNDHVCAAAVRSLESVIKEKIAADIVNGTNISSHIKESVRKSNAVSRADHIWTMMALTPYLYTSTNTINTYISSEYAEMNYNYKYHPELYQ